MGARLVENSKLKEAIQTYKDSLMFMAWGFSWVGWVVGWFDWLVGCVSLFFED